jgi:hypothetical protein
MFSGSIHSKISFLMSILPLLSVFGIAIARFLLVNFTNFGKHTVRAFYKLANTKCFLL